MLDECSNAFNWRDENPCSSFSEDCDLVPLLPLPTGIHSIDVGTSYYSGYDVGTWYYSGFGRVVRDKNHN